MEREGEVLKANRLYSVLMDENVFGMLDLEEAEEYENKEDKEEEEKFETKEPGEKKEKDLKKLFRKVTDKMILELINQEVNVSEGSNGGKSKKRKGWNMEERGKCVSSNLLVRTQQWKKDGVLLVRNFKHDFWNSSFSF